MNRKLHPQNHTPKSKKSLFLALAGCKSFSTPDVSDSSGAGILNEHASSAASINIPDTSNATKLEAIPFRDDQLYAVAYLGYGEIENLSFYMENYLDNETLPIHYLSKGEYYLIIPRYADMEIHLYRNDSETNNSILVYEEKECRPFIVQCNIRDIFSDAKICLTTQTETVEFSPYISLVDGNVDPGDRGLDITISLPF